MPDLYPPMGVGCVASALRAAGFSVRILDLPIMGVAEDDDATVLDLLKAEPPDIVGFTAVTMTYPTCRRLAEKIRATWPDLPLLIGGVHVTDAPQMTLEDPQFDYSVAGEGEAAATALCRGIAEGHVPGDIPGVGYHRADPPYCRPRADLTITDYPPTAYDLYDLDAYRRIYKRMSIITQRGCNARCIFCSSGFTMPRVRYLPLERVMSELTFLVRDKGFEYINIYDSNFTSRNDWVHKICDAIIESGLRFRWRCFSKSNGVDVALFRKMRAAGCSHVLFGVESSHDTTLKLIRKGNRRHHVVSAMEAARQAGLNRVAYSIVGLPGETREMVLETIAFLEALDAEWNVVSPIALMPGTPLYDQMSAYRMVIDEADWSQGSQGMATASNSEMGAAEIEALCEEAFARLNGGRDTYNWHEVVSNDPGTCPHVSMMSLVDPVS
ncbi:radical SAM protein [Breoghania sp. JC706]|uniref:B12-binding domain-containing radical SAM protein n=1 Tax=Breoghania sp. JC706 TaxID=3117732 RepID=UPI00300A08B9